MSRIRSIHPGLWTDEAFMGLSVHARLFLMGLWTEAFDDGVFEWKPLTLKARIFPVDDVNVPDLLDELVTAGCIKRIDHAAKPAGAIRNFRKFQRPKTPNKSDLLPADCRNYVGLESDTSEPLPNHYGNASEKSPQMEDGGGKREEIKEPPQPPKAGGDGGSDKNLRANGFWDQYPKTVNCILSKAQAEFDALTPEERDACLAGVRVFRSQVDAEKAKREAKGQAPPRTMKAENWIKAKGWQSLDIPIPSETLNRDRDRLLWAACENITGKKAATSGHSWSWQKTVVDQARTQLNEGKLSNA